MQKSDVEFAVAEFISLASKYLYKRGQGKLQDSHKP